MPRRAIYKLHIVEIHDAAWLSSQTLKSHVIIALEAGQELLLRGGMFRLYSTKAIFSAGEEIKVWYDGDQHWCCSPVHTTTLKEPVHG